MDFDEKNLGEQTLKYLRGKRNLRSLFEKTKKQIEEINDMQDEPLTHHQELFIKYTNLINEWNLIE